jgi:hypothetical protein
MRRRSARGFSVAAIMAMSVIAGLWVLGLASVVMPAYQKITRDRTEVNVRAGAESALDWAVSQLNVIYAGGSSPLTDDTTQDGASSAATAVPTAVLPNNVTAQVWVNKIQPPTTSYIYDQTLDPVHNTNIPAGNFGWRVVTATATLGSFTKTVRVIARPTYPVTEMFAQAVLSNGPETWTGNHSSMDGYNSNSSVPAEAGGTAIAGNNSIASFQPISLGGSISGNVTYYGTGATAGGTANISVGSGSPAIWGQVLTNDVLSVAQNGEPASQIGGNLEPSGTGSKWVTPAPSPPSVNVPGVPAGAAQLTSWTSSSYTITVGGVSTTYNTGSLPPGDYQISNLSMAQGMNAAGASGDVRIWVSNTLSVGGGGDLAGYVAKRMQVYYTGSSSNSCSISLNGSPGQFCGCIMAPNVNMSVNGQGHFYGAVVCNSLLVHGSGNSGGMSFDQALLQAPIQFPGTPHLTVISWQEI